MATHCIRKATREDFDDVMAIGEVLRSGDYLWYRYNAFMDDPNATGYIYLVDKTVVAFCAVFLIDDGQTYHVRAGRVKDGYRGQGIYVKLLDYAQNKFRDVPSIQHNALVVDDVNYDAMKERLFQTYTLLFSKTLHHFGLKAEDILSSKYKMESCPSLREMTSDDVTSLIQNQEVCSHLFPNDRIVTDWVPLRLMPSNIKYIMGQNNIALVSQLESDTTSLLTVGTPILTPSKMRYVIDVFGYDGTLFRYHILRHIDHARTVRCVDVVFQIHAPADEKLNKVICSVATDLGLEEETGLYTSLHLFERPFKRYSLF